MGAGDRDGDRDDADEEDDEDEDEDEDEDCWDSVVDDWDWSSSASISCNNRLRVCLAIVALVAPESFREAFPLSFPLLIRWPYRISHCS